jgi:hypothetical protein
MTTMRRTVLAAVLIASGACASEGYRDPKMDFGSIYTVGVMPFVNLSKDQAGSERVRDVFMTMLLSTGEIYVVAPGEVARQIALAGVLNPAAPTIDEAVKLGKMLKVDAIITGVIREYGEVRSGTASATVLSMSIQMIEIQTGKVVYSASSTKGGIGVVDRLFGGGGEPMNVVTEKTVKDVINSLFK